MSVICFLWIATFFLTIVAITGRVPLWVPVLVVSIIGLLGCLPLR